MADLGNIGLIVGGVQPSYQPNVSGTGTISGTLQQAGSNCNARVWLYSEQFDYEVDFFTLANGSYSFGGLNTAQTFTVIATDLDSNNYNKLVYRAVAPA